MELIESVIELAVSLTASIVRFATDLRFARRAGFRGTSLAVEDDEDELEDFLEPRERLLLPEALEPPFLAPDFRAAFLPPDFFAPPLRADDFFAPLLRAVDFFAPPLRAVAFFAPAFFAPPLRADDFFAPPLRAVAFFAPPFLDEALRAAGRLAEDFFAPPFFDEDFLDVAILISPFQKSAWGAVPFETEIMLRGRSVAPPNVDEHATNVTHECQSRSTRLFSNSTRHTVLARGNDEP